MDSTEGPIPNPPRHSKRSALVGALVGMSALAATIVGVGAIANADDTAGEPQTTVPVDTTPPPIGEDGAPTDELTDDANPWHPFEEDAWRPYEECVDDRMGDLDETWMDLGAPTEADFDAYDAAWQTADDACRELLPEEALAEMAMWEAFDECLNDAGVFDGAFGAGTLVQIDTPDGFRMVEFGDVEGSVTITGTADGVTVTSDGGVTVLDEAALDAQWAAFDEAQAACEQLLPEDAFGEFDLDELGELDEDHADG